MSDHWVIFARHDKASGQYLSLTVGPVPADQLERQTQRTVSLPFREGEIVLDHVHTFDHDPTDDDMDELAPAGHKSSDQGDDDE